MTAGGAPICATFLANPQHRVEVTAATRVLVLLEQPDLRMCYTGKSDPFDHSPPPPMFPTAIGLVVRSRVGAVPARASCGSRPHWLPCVGCVCAGPAY
jgi:hypothetical protein